MLPDTTFFIAILNILFSDDGKMENGFISEHNGVCGKVKFSSASLPPNSERRRNSSFIGSTTTSSIIEQLVAEISWQMVDF